MMAFLAISGLLNGISCFLLGMFVYLREKKNLINKTYFLFALSVGIWSLGYFFWPRAEDKSSALNSFRLLHFGAVFIPVFYYHFILAWSGRIKERRHGLLTGYILAAGICLFIPSRLFIKDITAKFILRFWPVPGILYHLYLAYFFYYAFAAIYLIFKELKISKGIRRSQCKYLLTASIIGYLGGATNYPLWYNIPLYPVFNCFVILYVAIIAYAILRHHLLDIEIVIKKSLVFAGMFAFAFGVFVAIVILVSRFIGGYRLVSLAISACIIALGMRPLENFLINSTDKYLFQKKYEYKQILRTFIDEVITVLNLDEVINSTLELLDRTLHPYNAAVFILNKAEDKYQLYNSKGIDDKNTAFNSNSRLIAFLRDFRTAAVIKPDEGITSSDIGVQQEMSQIKAVLCLPLLLHNELIGFISLGRKKSDEEYTKDELDTLLDLSRTESISIGNAQLLTDAAQTERRAVIGVMAAGIYHEIGNPLNVIQTKIQLFILGIDRGFYKDKTKEEIIRECKNILNDILKQTTRIADTTRRFSDFAKPGKEFKPELVNVTWEIDEALAVIRHEIDIEPGRITIKKEIPEDSYKILADKREIQQIFFNIIRNALQAIKGTGAIIIRAFVTAGNKVRIEIQDTGCGIAQEKLHRIFEPFFTTKGPDKGTGLGLFIVRQLVWKNRGEISFISQAGNGTTFILEFPKG